MSDPSTPIEANDRDRAPAEVPADAPPREPAGAAGASAGGQPATGPAPKPGRRFVFTLIELMIVIAIIGVLAAISTPKFGAARERAGTRACYANQKTLVGAIEMFDLDRKTRTTVLDDALFVRLKSGGYLQSIPQDPGQGTGTSGHYILTTSGNGIRCQVHGSIQDSEPATSGSPAPR